MVMAEKGATDKKWTGRTQRDILDLMTLDTFQSKHDNTHRTPVTTMVDITPRIILIRILQPPDPNVPHRVRTGITMMTQIM
jgi:hypothetical protein